MKDCEEGVAKRQENANECRMSKRVEGDGHLSEKEKHTWGRVWTLRDRQLWLFRASPSIPRGLRLNFPTIPFLMYIADTLISLLANLYCSPLFSLTLEGILCRSPSSLCFSLASVLLLVPPVFVYFPHPVSRASVSPAPSFCRCRS